MEIQQYILRICPNMGDWHAVDSLNGTVADQPLDWNNWGTLFSDKK